MLRNLKESWRILKRSAKEAPILYNERKQSNMSFQKKKNIYFVINAAIYLSNNLKIRKLYF